MLKYIISCLVIFPTMTQAVETCPFQKWEKYNKTKLSREGQSGAYIFSTSHVDIDADGAPNAYHPDDVGLDCKNGTGFKGLDCPENGGYPNSDWWQSAIVPDPKDNKKGYVQPDGNFKGYFVSQTTLGDDSKANLDPKKYVDSTQVPYLVFPGNFYSMNGTGLIGDFGYAINTENSKTSPFIVAEVGPPKANLGEMSIFLGNALGGSNPNPRTGSGAPEGEIIYVIFPYSKNSPAWPLSQEEIQSKVTKLLSTIGGEKTIKHCFNAHK
jgi:hypothetical protein